MRSGYATLFEKKKIITILHFDESDLPMGQILMWVEICFPVGQYDKLHMFIDGETLYFF